MKEEFVWEAEKSHGGVLFLLVLVLTKAVVGGESAAGTLVKVVKESSFLNNTYGTRTQRSLYVQNRGLQYWPRHKKGRRNLSCHNVQLLVDHLHVVGPCPRNLRQNTLRKNNSFPDRVWLI